jgi:Lrp/AsnC family leucine-responsive transcriptional regulator
MNASRKLMGTRPLQRGHNSTRRLPIRNLASQLQRILDRTGCRVLSVLTEEARISSHELGRRVSLSAPAAAERVRRLEQAGVITGYRAEVDHRRLGYPVLAFVNLQTNNPRAADLARSIPEVLECHRITGRDSFILKVVARSVDDLESLLDRLMPYGAPTTSLVLSSPVPPRPLACIPADERMPAR